MTIENFQQEVNAMFPCRWEDDFVQDVQKTFDIYISHVSGLDKIKEDVIGEIKALCTKLSDVLKLYYDGRKGEAYMKFSTIMNGDTEAEGLFASIGYVDINPEEVYYRARERKIGENFSIIDMFHIPLNKRGIVSTQRYSSPGYPCLYLGNTVYSCWEELRRMPFDNLMFSAYKVKMHSKYLI